MLQTVIKYDKSIFLQNFLTSKVDVNYDAYVNEVINYPFKLMIMSLNCHHYIILFSFKY